MKSLHIISVGKPLSHVLDSLCDDYQKRCKIWFNVIDQLIEPSKYKNTLQAVADESRRIEKALPQNALVVLLDERGRQFDSLGLSRAVVRWHEDSRSLYFVIGGASGVDELFRQRADVIWSFSEQVFPHKLMRVLLNEQLYRSMAISKGLPYHHA